MEDKLHECFEDMVVYKDLKKSNFFSSLELPSFLRDWVLKRFEDDNGDYDIEAVTDFVKTYLPKKEEWLSIKNRITYENERVKILTKISVDIDIKTGEISFLFLTSAWQTKKLSSSQPSGNNIRMSLQKARRLGE